MSIEDRTSSEIAFLVRGRSQPATADGEGNLIESVLVGVTRGDDDPPVKLLVNADQIVKLQLVNGPELVLNAETARELFAAQADPHQRDQGKPSARGVESKLGVQVPTRMGWPGATAARGESAAREVVLQTFHVVKETVSSQGANLAADALSRILDAANSPRGQGLFQLRLEKAELGAQVDLAPCAKILVLVHGTFSNTFQAFGKLWSDHPELLRKVFAHFGADRVFAFEHHTLRESPLENALRLAELLPAGAEVHFLTHSRGGLIAEALAQLASQPQASPVENELTSRKNYQEQLAPLERLRARLAEQPLTIKRIVRVGCPLRGTLLASTRLDAYLSVFKWTLQLAGVQVIPEFVGFVAGVAKRRTKPDELPGLEAMMPNSPFISWLNAADLPIAGEVRVVAGDMQGDSVISWLKTLLADSFYWTDNDLVVQTRSMYGGAPRAGQALFVLDRGAKVSHFNYFANQASADATVEALTVDEKPRGFAPLGPLSSRGLDSSGIRSEASAVSSIGDRPVLFVLPGMLGSHLKVVETDVWLSCRMINGLRRLEYGKEAGPVQAQRLLEPYYDELLKELSEKYEVRPFPFDWRLPIEEEARRLAVEVDAAMNSTSKPVKILAHSMGALVARALECERPDVWQRFIDRVGARLLMLAPPNGGTWLPMQILSGDHWLGGLLNAVGALFDEQQARRVFAAFPGLLQLQAELKRFGSTAAWEELKSRDLAAFERTVRWHSLAIQSQSNEWVIPDQATLDQATALRAKLDAQKLGSYGNRVLIVVGNAASTPGPVSVSNERGVSYADVLEGDGTVPLESALLDGVIAYRSDTEHAELSRRKALFAVYLGLLEEGSTAKLDRVVARGSARGEPVLAREPQHLPRTAQRGLGAPAPSALADLFALSSESEESPKIEGPALRVSVANGNLMFVRQPLMLGHYRSQTLTGAEAVMDRLTGKTMSRALDLDDYPQELETSKSFLNLHRAEHDPFAVPRPKSVVVVGMGDEGELRGVQLTRAVTRAVVSYAQHLVEKTEDAASSFELASTLLGSGGMGVTVATSAVAVAHGVRNANRKLQKWQLPTVSTLHFIELYEDRATEALRAISAAAERTPQLFQVESVLDQSGHQGGLPRPEDASYRGANYDMISAITRSTLRKSASPGAEPTTNREGPLTIEFKIDTKRARTESSDTTNQTQLLENLIRDAEGHGPAKSLGRTLFQILVPRELDSYFGNSEAVLLEVDDLTAGIPWELLDTEGDSEQKPWAVRAKLLRKRRSQNYRQKPRSADRDAQVLVIGEPDCGGTYPRLYGAVQEAIAVAALFNVEPLLQKNAAALIGALFQTPYRIIHIAGHGKADGTGVVLSDQTVLDSELIERLGHVPDLVFVNCCHSGRQGLRRDEEQEKLQLDRGRPGLAANIAGQLIRIGVRCVIATGWAVDDDAAERFAMEFYQRLLTGSRFIDAVSDARERVWSEYRTSQTWAAYQCYGDPDWQLPEYARTSGEASGPLRPASGPEPLLASPSALIVVLKTLADRGNTAGDEERPLLLARLKDLDARYHALWPKNGAVAEAFAIAYRELGSEAQLESAIEWFDKAASAEDGSATQRALEQLYNLRCRRAAERALDAFEAGEATFQAGVAKEIEEIESCTKSLRSLYQLRPSYERANLIASATKRLAIVHLLRERQKFQGAGAAADAAIELLASECLAAETLGKQLKIPNLHYAQLTRMSAQIVHGLRTTPRGKHELGFDEARSSLEQLDKTEPSFWTLAQQQELTIYEALCERALAEKHEKIGDGLKQLHDRLKTPRAWSSVRDQARFTLGVYALHASPEEAQKAQDLLAQIESYATPGQP